MTRFVSLLAIIGGLLAGQQALAQTHPVTWDERIRAVDETVSLFGQTHTIARVPAIDFGTGTRYAVFLPWGGTTGFQQSAVSANHDESPLQITSPDSQYLLTISGFPALLTFSENTSVSVGSDFTTGLQVLRASRLAFLTLSIDIGDTILILSKSFSENLTNANMGTAFNAVQFAEWQKYSDDPAIINAADKWIDFIRVKPL